MKHVARFYYASNSRERAVEGEPPFIMIDRDWVVGAIGEVLVYPSPLNPKKFFRTRKAQVIISFEPSKEVLRALQRFEEDTLLGLAAILEAEIKRSPVVKFPSWLSALHAVYRLEDFLIVREGLLYTEGLRIWLTKWKSGPVEVTPFIEKFLKLSEFQRNLLMNFWKGERDVRLAIYKAFSEGDLSKLPERALVAFYNILGIDPFENLEVFVKHVDLLEDKNLRKKILNEALRKRILTDPEKYLKHLMPELVLRYSIEYDSKELYDKIKSEVSRDTLRNMLDKYGVPSFAIEEALRLGLYDKVPVESRPDDIVLERALKGDPIAIEEALRRKLYVGRECDFVDIHEDPSIFLNATSCPDKAANAAFLYIASHNAQIELPDRILERIQDKLVDTNVRTYYLRQLSRLPLNKLSSKVLKALLEEDISEPEYLEELLRRGDIEEIDESLCHLLYDVDPMLLEGIRTECPIAIKAALRYNISIHSNTLERIKSLKRRMKNLKIEEYPGDYDMPPQHRIYMGLKGEKRYAKPLKKLHEFIRSTGYMQSLLPYVEIALDRLGVSYSRHHEYIEELSEYLTR